MKLFLIKNLLCGLMLFSAAAAATPAAAQQPPQLRLPRLSPKQSVTQTIGITDVTITYSRPGVKKRAVWGELVPYGQVWRTGANEATTFTVTDDVTINGQKLPAGTYSLHTIPTKDEWTIIFNKEGNQWGSYSYDEKKDALRVKVKPQTDEFNEWLAFEFDDIKPNSADVAIRWERIKVPFTIDVGDVTTTALTRARAAIAAAAADDWNTPLQAANFSFQNKVNMDEAMTWLDKSIKIKETPNNLWAKARVMAEMGKTHEAVTYGEKALKLVKAGDPKVDTSAQEKTLAGWRAKKM